MLAAAAGQRGHTRKDRFNYAGLRRGLGGFVVRAGLEGLRQNPHRLHPKYQSGQIYSKKNQSGGNIQWKYAYSLHTKIRWTHKLMYSEKLRKYLLLFVRMI